MAPVKVSWQEKVGRALKARGLSVPKLAKRLGRSDRTVLSWLRGERDPLHEHGVISQIAAALEIPADWFTDGEDSQPSSSPVPADVDGLAKKIPARFRRLVFALADFETAEFLLAQLDLYEKTRRRARASRA